MKTVVAISWLVLAVLLVVGCRGSFGHGILLTMATLAAFGFWAVGGLLVLLAGRGPSRWKGAGRAFLVFGSLLCSLWVTLPFGFMLHRRDVAEAQAFCEALIPAIERIKAQTGRYPATPPDVDPGAAWPRLIDQDHFYWADADGYSFIFIDPSGMLDSFEYRSWSRQWYQTD